MRISTYVLHDTVLFNYYTQYQPIRVAITWAKWKYNSRNSKLTLMPIKLANVYQ